MHWKYRRCLCVLTNHRIIMLSLHRVFTRPHHEVIWLQPLQNIKALEVATGNFQPVSYVPTSRIPASNEDGPTASIWAGNPQDATSSSDNFSIHVNNTVVYVGISAKVLNIRDRILRAKLRREQELGVG